MNNYVCPYCGGEVGVIDTRVPKTSNTIRRRRICFKCGRRFSTFEVDSDTYNTLLKILKNIGIIRGDLNYLLDKIDNIMDLNEEAEDD